MEELVASALMMSNINILRHKIELTNFNDIEKSSERSILAHMMCGQNISVQRLFDKLHAHGMFDVPNEVGTIITQLSCKVCV